MKFQKIHNQTHSREMGLQKLNIKLKWNLTINIIILHISYGKIRIKFELNQKQMKFSFLSSLNLLRAIIYLIQGAVLDFFCSKFDKIRKYFFRMNSVSRNILGITIGCVQRHQKHKAAK